MMGSGLITVFIKGTPKLDRDSVADTGGSGSSLLVLPMLLLICSAVTRWAAEPSMFGRIDV